MIKKTHPSPIVTQPREGGTPTNIPKIDHYFRQRYPQYSDFKLYTTSTKTYSKILTSVDIAQRTNCFYKIQLITLPSHSIFMVIARAGKVGAEGTFYVFEYQKLKQAIKDFNSRVKKRLAPRGRFSEIEVLEDNQEDYNEFEVFQNLVETESDFSGEVVQLFAKILGLQIFGPDVLDLGYDAQKMPLGFLSPETIQKARDALEALSKEIENTDGQRSRRSSNQVQIKNFNHDFYSMIPHIYTNNDWFLLKTEEDVEEKRDLLEELSQMTLKSADISLKLNKKNLQKVEEAIEDLENLDIEALSRQSKVYKMFENYAYSTMSYGRDLISQIFEVNNQDEFEEFESHSSTISNHRLLWFPCTSANVLEILKNGIQSQTTKNATTPLIFTESCGNAFGMLGVQGWNQNEKFSLICEVACGDDPYIEDPEEFSWLNRKKNHWKVTKKKAKGKHSVMYTFQDLKGHKVEEKVLSDGVILPVDKSGKTTAGDSRWSYAFDSTRSKYWAVFNPKQVRVRYLVQYRNW